MEEGASRWKVEAASWVDGENEVDLVESTGGGGGALETRKVVLMVRVTPA